MATKIKSKNSFLTRIANHLGYRSINNPEFFLNCDTILGQGGATNYFVESYNNREFLKNNRSSIQSIILEFFDSIGENPRNYNYTCFGNPLDEETVSQILAFLYGSKTPKNQGTACDWLVWCAVETEIYNREEEISHRKWEK